MIPLDPPDAWTRNFSNVRYHHRRELALTLQTGFWVLQNTPTAHKAVRDIMQCPVENPECNQYRLEWAHEQAVRQLLGCRADKLRYSASMFARR